MGLFKLKQLADLHFSARLPKGNEGCGWVRSYHLPSPPSPTHGFCLWVSSWPSPSNVCSEDFQLTEGSSSSRRACLCTDYWGFSASLWRAHFWHNWHKTQVCWGFSRSVSIVRNLYDMSIQSSNKLKYLE